MCPPDVLLAGVAALVVGVPAAAWPYELARLEEVLDAIGRKPAGPVEPADWRVTFTRVVGVALSLFGAAAAGTCLLG